MNRGFAGAPAETHSLTPVATNIPVLLERMPHRFPSFLVDAVIQHERGRRLVAVKNVTVGEEFFQGHFPGTPLMPGVLMIEALSQAAAVLLFEREEAPVGRGLSSRGGQREVQTAGRAGRSAAPGSDAGRAASAAREGPRRRRSFGDQVVAEADSCWR